MPVGAGSRRWREAERRGGPPRAAGPVRELSGVPPEAKRACPARGSAAAPGWVASGVPRGCPGAARTRSAAGVRCNFSARRLQRCWPPRAGRDELRNAAGRGCSCRWCPFLGRRPLLGGLLSLRGSACPGCAQLSGTSSETLVFAATLGV